ncbi:DNA-binding protein Fis [compost metagenome]
MEKVVEILRDNKGKGYNALLVEFEKVMLEEALVMTRGNQTRAAEVLGLNRGTLRKKISYLSSTGEKL